MIVYDLDLINTPEALVIVSQLNIDMWNVLLLQTKVIYTFVNKCVKDKTIGEDQVPKFPLPY